MKQRIRWILCGVIGIYLALPFAAGVLKIGERAGPALYPEVYHELAYRIGYSLAGHGKPRVSFYGQLYRTPLFYGFKPDLISESEAQEIFDCLRSCGNIVSAQTLEERYRKLAQSD